MLRRSVLAHQPTSCTLRTYSTAPKKATVARYTRHGSPQEVLSLQTEDLPPLGKKQVLVQMLYAPINPSDLNVIAGSYPIQPPLPAVGGGEGLGKIVEVGEGASRLKVGDYVIPANLGFGTWRTAAVCDETELLAVSALTPDVKPEYLATLSVNPASAYRMLQDFVPLKSGDVFIQNGANSMVGLSAIQIAASRGIKSINIIRRRSDYNDLVDRMKTYGAYMVVGDDYVRTPEFRKLIADLPQPKLALNCVGGPSATELTRLLAPGGTMVTYGGMSLQPVTVPTSQFIFNDITLKGFWMSRWYKENGEKARVQLLSELVQLVKDNKLRLWTEKHAFAKGFDVALSRAINSSVRDRKVLLSFE